MNRVFFYRQGKGLFVVASLAVWLGLLGLFGRHLPANAGATNSQLADITSTGSISPGTPSSRRFSPAQKAEMKKVRIQLAKEIGNWAKIDNQWQWQKAGLSKQTKLQKNRKRKSRWVRRNGVWVFEKMSEQDLRRNI